MSTLGPNAWASTRARAGTAPNGDPCRVTRKMHRWANGFGFRRLIRAGKRECLATVRARGIPPAKFFATLLYVETYAGYPSDHVAFKRRAWWLVRAGYLRAWTPDVDWDGNESPLFDPSMNGDWRFELRLKARDALKARRAVPC